MKGLRGYNKWSDRDVATWAKAYTRRKKETLITLEDSLGISHSTLWWCFQNRLGDIDTRLYLIVMEKLDVNKRKGGRRNGR